MKSPLLDVLREVLKERKNQDRKWGEQNHDALTWLSILTEEVGEVAKDINEVHYYGVRCELIQVAAVAVAAVESMDRQERRAKELTFGALEGNVHG